MVSSTSTPTPDEPRSSWSTRRQQSAAHWPQTTSVSKQLSLYPTRYRGTIWRFEAPTKGFGIIWPGSCTRFLRRTVSLDKLRERLSEQIQKSFAACHLCKRRAV